ncbi:MAG: TolC family protein [Bacteroidia bacterium]|nr:TolC family protein [Bacteroidia bacterium]
MNKYIPLFILFGAQTLLASNQDSIPKKTSFSLKEAQAYAAENAYAVKEVKYNISQAEQQVREYTAIGLPQINGEATFTDFLVIPTSVIPAGGFFGSPEPLKVKFNTKYNSQVNASGSQLVFDGSFFVGLQAAKALVQLTKDGQKKSELDVKDNVTQAYYTVLIVQETQKLLEQSLINLEKAQLESQAFLKGGFAEETDVDQFTILVSNLKNQIEKTKANIENAKGLLKFQMGMSVKDPIELTDNIDIIADLANSPGLLNPSLDPKNSIEYLLLGKSRDLQLLNVKRIKMGYLPSARVFGSAGYNQPTSTFNWFKEDSWFPSVNWGFNISVPIFDGFMKDAGIKKARLDAVKTQNTMDQLEQGMNLQLQTAKTDFIAASNQLKNEEKSLELSKKVRDKALIKFKEGVGSSMEITQAENQLVSVQGAYFQALMNQLIAKAKIDRLLGNY